MDLSYGREYEAFREEVRAFVAEAWPAGLPVVDPPHDDQQRFILDATARGYMYRSIPRRFGGSEQPFDALREAIISEEFDRAAVPWRLGLQGVGMIVPTLLEVGAEWQREKFIAPTLRGDFTWCQGYSEPNAGSDLASLRSSARLEGEEWIINGQKIWTSDATDAGYMFGMFRTEPDAPKHGGISYLLLEMDQPGVEVRPLRQITGSTHFFEVFFDDARTPADWIVGRRGEGWQVARVNLKHERTLSDGSRARTLFRQLVALANRTTIDGQPATRDTVVRQRLAELECYVRCTETMTLRRLSATARGEDEKTVTPTLVNKLFGSDVTERMVRLAYDLIGAEGLRAPTDATWGTTKEVSESTDWVDQYLYSLAARIAAGSSNIQRNIIGERVLGLPRDLRAG